jgi:hypothetical protein
VDGPGTGGSLSTSGPSTFRPNADGYHQASVKLSMESLIAKAGIAVIKPALTQWVGANKPRNLARL